MILLSAKLFSHKIRLKIRRFIPFENIPFLANKLLFEVTLDVVFLFQPNIDLAESLISLGFAKTVQQTKEVKTAAGTSTDAQLESYLKKLQLAQSKASARDLPWPLSILMARIWRLIYVKLLPSKYRLPELVR